MFLWIVIEPILAILCALFIITQVAIPAWRNTPTFPLVRRIFKRRRIVEEQIRELRAIKEVQELEQEATLMGKNLKSNKRR
jgi:hypothetical protein